LILNIVNLITDVSYDNKTSRNTTSYRSAFCKAYLSLVHSTRKWSATGIIVIHSFVEINTVFQGMNFWWQIQWVGEKERGGEREKEREREIVPSKFRLYVIRARNRNSNWWRVILCVYRIARKFKI